MEELKVVGRVCSQRLNAFLFLASESFEQYLYIFIVDHFRDPLEYHHDLSPVQGLNLRKRPLHVCWLAS